MNDVGVGAIILGVVSTISGMYQTYTGRMSAREKLQYDAELVSLRTKITNCEASHEECKKETAQLWKTVNENHGAAVADRKNIKEKVDKLESSVTGASDQRSLT